MAVAQAAPLTLEFPGPAQQTGQRREVLTSYRLATGPFAGGVVPAKPVEGALDQTAWRFPAPGLATLQLMEPLRAQVARAGFKIIYECASAECGGFDFRYGTEVLPEPDMHIDLGDFRYLAAGRDGADGPEYLSLIVSRAGDQGFVQLTQVGGKAGPATDGPATDGPATAGLATDGVASGTDAAEQTLPEPEAPAQPVATGGDLGGRLQTTGALVLEDLLFASGKSALAAGDYASLAELAAWLRANPAALVTLVGHTDAAGGLDGNIALSRKRAESVRQRLIAQYDVVAAQVFAQGVGYLAPRDTNLTEAGQARNRRVEVMLTSTP